MVKMERNHLLRRSTGQRRKHTQMLCYVPLKEDLQPDWSRGTSHKEKDLNNWPEENMLPGTFMFQSLPSNSTHSL